MSEFGNHNPQDRLSAAIDSELSDLDLLDVSHQLCKDQEMRETLVRYQMISDSMRGEEVNVSALDLVNSVSQRLQSEPTILAPVKSRSHLPKWVQPAAGAALAASVAAVGIMLGPQFINNSQPQNMSMDPGLRVVAQPLGKVSPTPVVAKQDEHWKTVEGKTRTRLDNYLEQHSQYAVAPGGVQGVMPYTSFVSYGQPRK